MKPAGVGL